MPSPPAPPICVDGDYSPWRRAVERARGRWGVVTYWELRALGGGHSTVRDWLASGRLIRLHRGVYVVGHDRLQREGFWLAAQLACGPGAALSYAAAAAALDLRPSSAQLIDVSATTALRRKPGIRLHRPRTLDGDVVELRGIRVTSPTRTIIDMAAALPLAALETLGGRAERRGLIDHGRLAQARSRKLRAMFDDPSRPPQVVRSKHEGRLLRAVRAAALPEPECNAWMTHGGGEEWQADMLFRRERVIVEVDDPGHRTRREFELDRLKDAVRQADGYLTPRFTHRQIDESLSVVIARLARLLQRADPR